MRIGFYFIMRSIKQNSISAFLKNMQKFIRKVLTNTRSIRYNKMPSQESNN